MKRKEKIVKKVFIVALVLLLVSAPLTGCSTFNTSEQVKSKINYELCVGFYTIVRDEGQKIVSKAVKQYPGWEQTFSSSLDQYDDESADTFCKIAANYKIRDYLEKTLKYSVKTSFDLYETTAPAIWSDVKNFYKSLQEYIDSL